jgi:hypothetical protein
MLVIKTCNCPLEPATSFNLHLSNKVDSGDMQYLVPFLDGKSLKIPKG